MICISARLVLPSQSLPPLHFAANDWHSRPEKQIVREGEAKGECARRVKLVATFMNRITVLSNAYEISVNVPLDSSHFSGESGHDDESVPSDVRDSCNV